MPTDQDILAAQIGRPLRATSRVLRTCHLGLPIVAEVPPLLDNGEPFPTRYWLTCPLTRLRISRLEERGGVRAAQAEANADEQFARALAAAHSRYGRDRDALVPPDAPVKPSGGVGGAAKGVKCLHAHYADHMAGNDNPVAKAIAGEVGELRCQAPCVVTEGEAARRNPDWTEPR